ncbi:uncharacterized protein F4812DRAFT_463120 [Daldinia caldariorum]|uniref:uncharacterized protein n=1 Tax=Daldinia caldariorum TaxID=326644 RepID=UPI0020075019|nr:uncharacterized protein F4812DRAFT_463120 [Daldinia caldariorum]KAI1464059.1 hypothetical protein F4812DRAFT_463120 [Daldinia caldariorum]
MYGLELLTDTFQVENYDEEGHDNLDASLSHNVPDIEVIVMPNSAVERAVEGHTFMSLYPMFTNEHGIASFRLAARFTMRPADELQRLGYPQSGKTCIRPRPKSDHA